MAKGNSCVLLGFDDEQITDKQKNLLDSTVNKIGGKPNYPSSEISIPPCPICGLKRLLILQIYAPLESSQFHRTLYVFCCANATCSSQSKGWVCVRVQQMEKVQEKEVKKEASRRQQPAVAQNINWCSGADEWDDGEGDDDVYSINNQPEPVDDDNCNEQNGNVISNNLAFNVGKNDNNRMSDEEEESNSMESDPIPAFDNLQLADDKNANCGAQGGAVGQLNSPNAFAEIEGEESELVSIDVPLAPERDLIAMLKQTSAIPSDIANMSLKSFYIAVDEERGSALSNSLSDHVMELMQEYQRKDEVRLSPSSPGNVGSGGGASGGNESEEKYEKGIPVHGDVMFHNFLSRIQENPGQVLRYSRNSLPLLIAPLIEPIPKCQNCGSDLLCEIQVLPTLIPKLRFSNGDPAPIEYGNVLILTCTKSCWDTPDKMRYEHAIAQQEI